MEIFSHVLGFWARELSITKSCFLAATVGLHALAMELNNFSAAAAAAAGRWSGRLSLCCSCCGRHPMMVGVLVVVRGRGRGGGIPRVGFVVCCGKTAVVVGVSFSITTVLFCAMGSTLAICACSVCLHLFWGAGLKM